MSDFVTFKVPNYLLQKGGILPVTRLPYARRGTLNRARDNAALVSRAGIRARTRTARPSWWARRPLDPKKHFIILTNLLANNLSSSPRNVRRRWSAVASRR
jgi:homoserine O-acetyltransferase